MKDYKKYRWFFTSTGKLVVGGKSAEQNDFLLGKLKSKNKDYYVMHTTHPGSPFSVIISDLKDVRKTDLEECAVFTGCLSRAWKERKAKTEVHLFKLSQTDKESRMKTGTWSVKGKVHKKKVKLELVLAKQNRTLRAVPEQSVDKEKVLLKICPGNVKKEVIAKRILEFVKGKNINKEELMSALPAGGIRICK